MTDLDKQMELLFCELADYGSEPQRRPPHSLDAEPPFQVPMVMPDMPKALDTSCWMNLAPVYEPGGFWVSRSLTHSSSERLSRTLVPTSSDQPVGIDDDQAVFLNASARGGKGVSFIIPNLCLWQGSCVVIDPKGENAIVTARRRAEGSSYARGMGQKVRILDPFGVVERDDDNFSDIKASFNPMDVLDAEKEESVDEAARLADAIIDNSGKSEEFWDDAARGFLKVILLHVATSSDFEDDERHLVTVRKLLLSGDAEMKSLLEGDADIPGSFDLLFEGMRRNTAFNGLISLSGEQMLELSGQSGRTLASLLQVVCTHTEFLDSPQLQAIIKTSDFELSELKTNRNGMSLYICLPQRYMETHHRWLRMMTSLTLTEMERIKHQPKCGKPVLMVLDEFAGLKRMKVIENAIAQIAGFGVKLMIVTQTLTQLKSVYKDNWESFISNTGTKIFFGMDDQFSRDYVAKLIGECEVRRSTNTQSHTQGTGTSKTRNHSTTKTTGETLNESRTRGHGDSRSRTHGSSLFSYSNTRGTNSSTSQTYGYSETSSEAHTYGESFTTNENQSDTAGTSESVHKRFLVTPAEIGRLFGNKDDPRALVLLSGEQPLQVRRSPYFADAHLEGLYDPHPDHKNPPTLVTRELAKHEELSSDMRHAITQLHQERELTGFLLQQTQESAAKAEQERENSHRNIENKLFQSSAKLAALIIAGILVMLFVLGVLGRFVLGIGHGNEGPSNLPLWDVVEISNFILPGAWAFILISGVAALIYGCWKLFTRWHGGLNTRQKYLYRL